MPRDPIVLNLRKHCLEKGWPYLSISEPCPFILLNLAPFESGKSSPVLDISRKPRTFIGCVENAKIIGEGSLFLEDGIILHGLTHHNSAEYVSNPLSQYLTEGYFPDPLPENGEIEEAVLCWGTENFGHWIFTYLHRLTLLWHKPELLTKPILVKTGTPPRFVEWLRRMGFENIVHGGDWVLVKKLWVPAVVHYRDSGGNPHFSPEALHAFRYLVLKDKLLPSPDKKRFFVSRRKAQWRRILNEEELTEKLNVLGIETVYMEDLDLEEQLELVSKAELIVMSAGGSSPITMLAPPECKIIELAPNAFTGAFASKTWACLLGQFFYRVRGAPVTGSSNKPIDKDFTIDVNEVIGIIKGESSQRKAA